jgi:hypothetical protein
MRLIWLLLVGQSLVDDRFTNLRKIGRYIPHFIQTQPALFVLKNRLTKLSLDLTTVSIKAIFSTK